MRQFLLLLVLMTFIFGQAQELETDKMSSSIDEKYLEDQLYVAFTYNLLLNKPSGINQNGLSGGFGLGFIKDIPFNKDRNLGIGLGLGYSMNIFIQNLKISEVNNLVNFERAEDYSTNKITKQSIDIPFEIRWRTSDPFNFKFWRIYAGMTFSYVFDLETSFKDGNANLKTRNIDEVEQFQYGLNLAAGRGTWNFYIYYSLSKMFKNSSFNQEPVDLNDVNFGLKFYIM